MPKSDREHGLLPDFTCPTTNTSRRMSMLFLRNRSLGPLFSGTDLLEGKGHTTLTVLNRLWSLAVWSDFSDCVCTCLIISLCLKCWFTHTDPLYRISKQWRRGHYHSLQQDTFWQEDNKTGFDVSTCNTKSLKNTSDSTD